MSAISSAHLLEQTLFFVILQLTIIYFAARLFSHIAKYFGQPQVVGEIVSGLILGPSLFGLIAPKAFNYIFNTVNPLTINVLGQVGLILLMLQIGQEFNFDHLRELKNKRTVILISLMGIAFPFVLGYFLGEFSVSHLFPTVKNALGYKLFLGTAMSITAIPILGRIMIELNIHKTQLGALTITSASIDDICGWLILALVTALCLSEFSIKDFSLRIIALISYLLLAWLVLRPFLRGVIKKLHSEPQHLSTDLIVIILIVTFVSSMITYKIGVFAIFGGFIIGSLLYKDKEFVELWKNKISNFVSAFFLPIFFAYTGLRTNIGGLDSVSAWGWCLLVVVLAILGKFGGCYLAARISGLSHAEAKCIGIMMNTRALMELIVINVGLDLGVIPPPLFTMLVIMAILTTLITTPLLKIYLKDTNILAKVN